MHDVSQPRRALIVDDEPVIRMCLIDMLEEMKFVVHEADSAEEAMAMISDMQLDLVVTDQNMCGMKGTDFADYLCDTHEKLGVIIVSGGATSGRLDARISHLSKPFTFDGLAEAVARVTAQS